MTEKDKKKAKFNELKKPLKDKLDSISSKFNYEQLT